MISTRDLTLLPTVDELRSLLQSLAMLDAVISPEWVNRYYSFDARWSRHEQMGSMRNGSGDGFFALFNQAGCFLKGFAHESPMSPQRLRPPQVWPGVLESVPPEFSACLAEPAFSLDQTTFCLWRRQPEPAWQHGAIEFPAGDDPDGSAGLLHLLTGDPRDYAAWAGEYYEQDVPLAVVEHVYRHQPLTNDAVRSLNRRLTLGDLTDVMRDIGYP